MNKELGQTTVAVQRQKVLVATSAFFATSRLATCAARVVAHFAKPVLLPIRMMGGTGRNKPLGTCRVALQLAELRPVSACQGLELRCWVLFRCTCPLFYMCHAALFYNYKRKRYDVYAWLRLS